jgi:hypothetical protein
MLRERHKILFSIIKFNGFFIDHAFEFLSAPTVFQNLNAAVLV